MRSAVNDVGHHPAFPVTAGNQVYATGMTLRDWFAGQALAGRLATGNEDYLDAHDTAARCYAIADAMLAARSQGGAE